MIGKPVPKTWSRLAICKTRSPKHLLRNGFPFVAKCLAGLLLLSWASTTVRVASGANLSNSVEMAVSSGQYTLPARLYRPSGFEISPNPCPLVLFLHGAGESGTDNVAQVNNRIGGLITATQGTNFG